MKDMKKYIRRALPKIAAVFAAVMLCVPAGPRTGMSAPSAAVDVYQFSENGFYYTISAVSGNIEACVTGYVSPTGGAAGGIDHHKQFKEIVGGRYCGLHDKYLFSAHRFLERGLKFAVGVLKNDRFCQRCA